MHQTKYVQGPQGIPAPKLTGQLLPALVAAGREVGASLVGVYCHPGNVREIVFRLDDRADVQPPRCPPATSEQCSSLAAVLPEPRMVPQRRGTNQPNR